MQNKGQSRAWKWWKPQARQLHLKHFLLWVKFTSGSRNILIFKWRLAIEHRIYLWEIFKWKCNSMLWFLILLSSSFSQGLFSQCYNLPLQPLIWEISDSIFTKERVHLPCSRSKQCPLVLAALLQMLIISAVLLGFSQHLFAVLLPRDAAPDPENLGGCHCNGEGQRTGSRSHFCPRNKAGTGAVLTWAFLWQSHSLCNPHLISPSPSLAFVWYYVWVTLKSWPAES